MVTGTNGQTGPPVTFLVVEDPSGADDAVNSLCLEEKTVLGRPYNYKIATPFHAQVYCRLFKNLILNLTNVICIFLSNVFIFICFGNS